MAKFSPVQFFKEGVSFRLQHSDGLKRWISRAFRENDIALTGIVYVFCSDAYLLRLNRQYLGHHYLTDIITFDNSLKKNEVEADVFISIDRVAVNARRFRVPFRDELHRVMIHGALHLAGYNDKSELQAKRMRQAEDYWLGKRNFIKNTSRQ